MISSQKYIGLVQGHLVDSNEEQQEKVGFAGNFNTKQTLQKLHLFLQLFCHMQFLSTVFVLLLLFCAKLCAI